MAIMINPISDKRANVTYASKSVGEQTQIIPNYYGQDSAVTEQPKKRGFINRLKNGYINFRKFFINTGNVIVGTVKGLLGGAVGASAVLGASYLYNTFKKLPKDAVRKTLTTGNKILAGIVGAGILTIEIIKSKLKANDKGANLDHKWNTGHNTN